MKVFDGFAFFNELDLLELRLRELWDVVDHFIIVEATRTFQKQPKPLFLKENWDRYREFHSKMIPIVIDQYPTFWTKFRPVKTWHYDNHQKEGILQGLTSASPEDVVIVSDLDEIPRPEKVLEWKSKPGVKVFEQFQSYYYLNYVCTRINDYGGKAISQQNRGGFGRWRGSVMMSRKDLTTVKRARCYKDEEGPGISVIPEGGWHFSNMGGVEALLYKMKSWAHSEYNGPEYTDLKVLARNILEGRDSIGENMKFELFNLEDPRLPWPQALLKNRERFQHLLATRESLESELKPLII